MMRLSVEEILEILKLIDGSQCAEFRLETTDVKLIVRKAGAGAAVETAPTAASTPAPVPGVATAPAPGPSHAAAATRPAAAGGTGMPAEPVPDGLVAIRAPMVGTFYRAPAPGAPPFVEVGSRVKESDTVCILEVMKLMSSIQAGVRGRVARICVENASPVTHAQVLLLIEPEEAVRG